MPAVDCLSTFYELISTFSSSALETTVSLTTITANKATNARPSHRLCAHNTDKLSRELDHWKAYRRHNRGVADQAT
ncbi:hypothetical protein M3J09_001824 [Ascochyta lentis]